MALQEKQAATRLWTAYRGANAWADFDAAGALQTRYLFGLGMDSLIARTSTAGAVGWYLGDNLGSVRQFATTGGMVSTRPPIRCVRCSSSGTRSSLAFTPSCEIGSA